MSDIKMGDLVRVNLEPYPAYGKIIWIMAEIANVDYKNPITREHEVKEIKLSELTKIGTK